MKYPSWFISEYSDSWPGKVRQNTKPELPYPEGGDIIDRI